MKTAEELHDYIENCPQAEQGAAIFRLLLIASELNDRCRVLESRVAVAEAKLNAGAPPELAADYAKATEGENKAARERMSKIAAEAYKHFPKCKVV